MKFTVDLDPNRRKLISNKQLIDDDVATSLMGNILYLVATPDSCLSLDKDIIVIDEEGICSMPLAAMVEHPVYLLPKGTRIEIIV